MKKIFFLLGIVVLLGFLLRFYRLGEVPVGFHRDETFLGYNAYSLAKTGKDMSGELLPLHFRSFIYSPAGYSYFAVPFVRLFDLNPFTTRFPSALFGSLTIVITFFLAKELFQYRGSTRIPTAGDRIHPEHIGLVSALLLAISPWHINLSRTATENVIVVFFIALGILFYLLWVRQSKWPLLLLAFLSFGSTFLLYQAPRAFLPIFIPLMLLLLATPQVKKKLKEQILLFIIIILLPLSLILFSKDLSLRIKTVSIFATSETQLVLSEQIREDGISHIDSFTSRIFHNKPVAYVSEFWRNYFAHFSFDFLFTDRALPSRYTIPYMGILYILELPFLIIGILYLLDQRRRDKFFLFAWILAAPVGSALTFDDIPNLQRTLIALPALSIICANGLLIVLDLLKKWKRAFIGAVALFSILGLYSIVFYLHQYYVHQIVHKPWNRHEGYQKLVESVNSRLSSYDKAIVTTSQSAPAIFFLFYGKYDPSLFQEQTKNATTNDFDRIDFGKYAFSQEHCPLIELEIRKNEVEERQMPDGERKIMYVNSINCEIPKDNKITLLDEIRRNDQSLVFQVLEYKSTIRRASHSQ